MNRFVSILVTALILFSTPSGKCQTWELNKSVQIEGVKNLTVDGQKYVYLNTIDGELIKIDLKGDELVRFSPIKNGNIHSIDAWSRFKILLFYKNFQELVILDRFFGDPVRYNLQEFSVGYATIAALNFQRNVWIIDQTDFSLKQLDLENKALLINQPFNQILEPREYDFSLIKEYQNKLYVLDLNTGVLVLDNFGNLLEQIPQSNVSDMGFDDGIMYLFNPKNILIREILSGESYSVEPPKSTYTSMIKVGNTFCFANSEGLDIYTYLSGR